MIRIFILFVFIKLSFSTVTLSQNVGIGTSAPLSKLHIVDNSAINTKVRIETDNTPNLANIAINNTARAGGISMGIVNNFNTYGDPGENFIYSSVNAEGLNIINQNLSGNGHIAFYTSGNHLTTPTLYLSDNDRVGIGNTIPSEKLDVTGNARISALGGAGNAIVTTNNDGVLGRTAMTGNGSDVLVGTGAFVPISSLNDDDWTVVGANMYSTPSGNVGIGTTVPSTKLDVVGVIELSNEAPADPGSDIVRLGDGGTNLHIQTNYGYTRVGPQNANWSHFATDRARYYFDKGVTVNQGLVGSYDENLQLQTSGTTRMTVLNSNGNVGVGLPTPGHRLDVNGNIDVNSNIYYLRDNAGNSYGIGYGVEGGTEMTIFTDNIIDFVESDNDYVVMRIEGNSREVGINTNAPTSTLDVNGTVRIRGGGPSLGATLMASNANGNATWSNAGYGMVPIGTIVAWHKNATGVPALPAGWVECNGGTSNGITVPNLNGATTSKSGDTGQRGRFLRGNVTSGLFQTDQSNNLRWVNHDDSGNGDTDDFLDDDGTTVTIRNYSTSGDRFQLYLEGVETRVTNMSVVWIMRTQ